MHKHIYTEALRRTCFTGIMMALSVVLCRLLGYPSTGIWRVELGFLPIYAIAVLYGKWWAAASYGVADLIGAAIFTGVNPFILLEKTLIGWIMGLFFYHKKRVGFPVIFLSMVLVSVICDFLVMSVIFHFQFAYTWEQAFWFRGVNAAINCIIRIAILTVCDLRVAGLLLKEKEKFNAKL